MEPSVAAAGTPGAGVRFGGSRHGLGNADAAKRVNWQEYRLMQSARRSALVG
jgi:hypothetical protein